MCLHAILRVKYLADKASTLIEVSSERDLQAKIQDLQGKDQVTSIQVFPRHHDITLEKRWETTMYTAPIDGPSQATP